MSEEADGVDCSSVTSDFLHGEVAVHFLEEGKALKSISSAIVFGGFRCGVEFDGGRGHGEGCEAGGDVEVVEAGNIRGGGFWGGAG